MTARDRAHALVEGQRWIHTLVRESNVVGIGEALNDLEAAITDALEAHAREAREAAERWEQSARGCDKAMRDERDAYARELRDTTAGLKAMNERLVAILAGRVALEPSPPIFVNGHAARALAAERELAEAVGLLGRLVKYAREDRAETPGSTRLARALQEAVALILARHPALSPAPDGAHVMPAVVSCRDCGETRNFTPTCEACGSGSWREPSPAPSTTPQTAPAGDHKGGTET